MANSGGDSVNTDLDDELSENQSNHRYAYNVDDMEYAEVIKLMQYLQIESEESGLRDRLLLKNYLYTKTLRGSYEDKIQDTVNKTMKKYIAGKNKLFRSHLEIQELARTDAFQKEISSILEERFPKYMKQLQERITKLKNDEIEICIIGWTCAGKSTFFNILLGEDIMPTNVLPDTPCLVRLHNSQTRKIQYVAEDKSERTVQLTTDPGHAKQKLESILDKCRGSDQSLSAVDLYWPIPRLHEKVVFVDTPGIGEKNNVTQQVMTHVPNAAGYIFIVNSFDGGGILEGGIVQLFSAIANRDNETERNLGNVLFICNKWDLIKKHERETVWYDTMKKLKQYFGIFEDWQIIKFSASVELQLMQLRASPSDDFVKILAGLETLISRTIKKLFFDFSGWINNLMGKSVEVIKSKLSLISLSTAELDELKTKTETILKETITKLHRDSNKIETLVDTKKAEIIKGLQDYLNSSVVQTKLSDWPIFDWKMQCSEDIRERIHKLISEWVEEEEGLLKKGIADIERECSQLAENIKTCFVSISNIKIDCCPERNIEIKMGMMTFATISALASVTATSIETAMIASGSGIAISIINRLQYPLPLGLSVFVFVSMYLYKRRSELRKLSKEAMDKFSSSDGVDHLIIALFEDPFKKWIKQFGSNIQSEISSIQKLLHEQKADLQCTTDLSFTLYSLLHELEICLLHLKKINVEYFRDDSVSCECLSIESSSFSTTEMSHLHAITKFHQDNRFTLRVIHPNYSVYHLQEIQKLREMKHINFMTPEGVVFSTSIPEEEMACGCSIDSLRLLIPQSAGDLEHHVFSNQSVQNCYSRESSENFFRNMAMGITNGLSYVHEMGFVHGHLQLSSIMLADDMTPKLCDINILPSLKERNHSICIFHTAPEVINGETYSPKADIYSLGILLWELWYGRHTPPGMTLTENSVCNGVRPKFEEMYPKQAWINLMQSCWIDSPERRPSAVECVQMSLNVA